MHVVAVPDPLLEGSLFSEVLQENVAAKRNPGENERGAWKRGVEMIQDEGKITCLA